MQKEIDKTQKETIIVMMKTIIIAMLALVGVSQAVNGAESLFNKNEVSITLQGSTEVKSDDYAGAVGLRYFPIKYVGVEANAGLTDFDGATVDNAGANVVFRVPFDKYRVALNVLGGAQYVFDVNDYTPVVGGQLEYRFNKKWGIFGGYTYEFGRNEIRRSDDKVTFGLNLVF